MNPGGEWVAWLLDKMSMCKVCIWCEAMSCPVRPGIAKPLLLLLLLLLLLTCAGTAQANRVAALLSTRAIAANCSYCYHHHHHLHPHVNCLPCATIVQRRQLPWQHHLPPPATDWPPSWTPPWQRFSMPAPVSCPSH